LLSHPKNVFRWIFTYSYFAFDNVFNTKRGKKTLKNVKNVYYIYAVHNWADSGGDVAMASDQFLLVPACAAACPE